MVSVEAGLAGLDAVDLNRFDLLRGVEVMAGLIEAAQRFQMTKTCQKKVKVLLFHELLQIDFSRFESFRLHIQNLLNC